MHKVINLGTKQIIGTAAGANSFVTSFTFRGLVLHGIIIETMTGVKKQQKKTMLNLNLIYTPIQRSCVLVTILSSLLILLQKDL